uniref:Ig-like domain-containing protein n=1 Tax=Periophthalmus magnuspinnatus TaxID=409849 RepID=A0A3B4A5W5_9GOBI
SLRPERHGARTEEAPEVQVTLKKGAEEAVAPPSPLIPPKRSKSSSDQVVPGSLGPQSLSGPSAPVFTRKMRNAAVGTGCDIRLKVSVSGDPQPSLYWYHNEELLNMENQEYGGLWIRDCKPSDAGLYTCIANNHQGECKCTGSWGPPGGLGALSSWTGPGE